MISESFSGSYGSSPPRGNTGSSVSGCDGGGGGGGGILGLKLTDGCDGGSCGMTVGCVCGGVLRVGDGVFGGGGAVGAGEGGRGG